MHLCNSIFYKKGVQCSATWYDHVGLSVLQHNKSVWDRRGKISGLKRFRFKDLALILVYIYTVLFLPFSSPPTLTLAHSRLGKGKDKMRSSCAQYVTQNILHNVKNSLARPRAGDVLNRDSANHEMQTEQLLCSQNPVVLHLWWRGRSTCHCESRLFCCPGAGCGIQTSPHPPGSGGPPAERHPESEILGLWEGVRVGWQRGKGERHRERDRVSAHAARLSESAHAGRGLNHAGDPGTRSYKGRSQKQ